jgi:hypothetical protein
MEPTMSDRQPNAIADIEVARTSDVTFHMIDNRALAPDLLRSVREITQFMEGSDAGSAVRRWYHITATANFPSFKLGSVTCALKSTIRASIWMQQKKRARWNEEEELLVRTHVLLSSILTMIEPNGHANDNHGRAHLSEVMAETATTIRRVLQLRGM